MKFTLIRFEIWGIFNDAIVLLILLNAPNILFMK